MTAYIEIEHNLTWGRFDLTPSDLQAIGEFTRENISRWLDSDNSNRTCFEVGIYGWKNFHAVCDDVDIPWEHKNPTISEA